MKKKTPFIHFIATPLHKYIYDVNTNQLIKVVDDLYEYLKNENYHNNAKEEKYEQAIYNMKSLGLLSSKRPSKMEHPYSQLLKGQLNSNVQQISLQVTQNCNFRCSYCIYGHEEYLNQREHSTKKMNQSTAFKAVDFLHKHSSDRSSVTIGFYGGEPLLEFDLIKKTVEYAENLLSGKDVEFTITTNGSLLTDQVVEFLSMHRFKTMVSLDGPKEIHDRSRKFAVNGKGTFDVIEKNLKHIQIQYPDFYKNLRFNIVIDPRFDATKLHENFSKNEVFSSSTLQSTYIDDLFSVEKNYFDDSFQIINEINLFKAYLSKMKRYPENKVSKISKASIESKMDMTMNFMSPIDGLPDILSHSGPCIPGQRRLFVTVNGDFYPCERVSEISKAMYIGNLDNGFNYDNIYKILNIVQLTEEDCKNCWAINLCSICARLCDNNGELSSEMKKSNCYISKTNAENTIKTYIFIKEFLNNLENNYYV